MCVDLSVVQIVIYDFFLLFFFFWVARIFTVQTEERSMRIIMFGLNILLEKLNRFTALYDRGNY